MNVHSDDQDRGRSNLLMEVRGLFEDTGLPVAIEDGVLDPPAGILLELVNPQLSDSLYVQWRPSPQLSRRLAQLVAGRANSNHPFYLQYSATLEIIATMIHDLLRSAGYEVHRLPEDSTIPFAVKVTGGPSERQA